MTISSLARLAWLVAACGTSSPPNAPAPVPPVTTGSTTVTVACVPSDGHGSEPTPGALDQLSILTRPGAQSTPTTPTLEVALENQGHAELELANGLAIERLDGEAWVSISDRELSIVAEGLSPPACTRIAPGASFVAREPWTGSSCFGFCACDANKMVAPGTYRAVAHDCGRTRAAASKPFDWRK
jgi:hypothetical protein